MSVTLEALEMPELYDDGDMTCLYCDYCRCFYCTGVNADEVDGEFLPDDAAVDCPECIEIDETGVCPWCGVPT